LGETRRWLQRRDGNEIGDYRDLNSRKQGMGSSAGRRGGGGPGGVEEWGHNRRALRREKKEGYII